MSLLIYLLAPSYYLLPLAEKAGWFSYSYIFGVQSILWLVAYRHREDLSNYKLGFLCCLSLLFAYLAPPVASVTMLQETVKSYSANPNSWLDIISPFLFQFLRYLNKIFPDTQSLLQHLQIILSLGIYFVWKENLLRKRNSSADATSLYLLFSPPVVYILFYQVTIHSLLLLLLFFLFNLSHYLWRSILGGALVLLSPLGLLSLPLIAKEKSPLKILLGFFCFCLPIAIAFLHNQARVGLYAMKLVSFSPSFMNLSLLGYGSLVGALLLGLSLLIYFLSKASYKLEQKYSELFLICTFGIFFFSTNLSFAVFALLLCISISPPRDLWAIALILIYLAVEVISPMGPTLSPLLYVIVLGIASKDAFSSIQDLRGQKMDL